MPVHALLFYCLAQTRAPSREEHVLALLGEAHRRGSYRYSTAEFELATPPLGNGPVLVPRIQVLCGNADSGTFDDVRVRGLALELCRIYGLDMQADQREVEGEKSVVLDGLDRAAGIAFELRGRGCFETFCHVQAEDSAAALDASEYDWLVARGMRLHVADVANYRGYGDEFTPTLAYLAGLVRFLNQVTEGEDVELGGLLFEREAAWKPPFVAVDGLKIQSGNYGPEFLAERRVTLSVSCRGLPDFEDAPDRDGWIDETEERDLARRRLHSTRGAPSVLYLFCEAIQSEPSQTELGAGVRLRLHQTLAGAELVRESSSSALFLPSEFDLTQPFELELELSPGRYVFYGPALIGAAARE